MCTGEVGLGGGGAVLLIHFSELVVREGGSAVLKDPKGTVKWGGGGGAVLLIHFSELVVREGGSAVLKDPKGTVKWGVVAFSPASMSAWFVGVRGGGGC